MFRNFIFMALFTLFRACVCTHAATFSCRNKNKTLIRAEVEGARGNHRECCSMFILVISMKLEMCERAASLQCRRASVSRAETEYSKIFTIHSLVFELQFTLRCYNINRIKLCTYAACEYMCINATISCRESPRNTRTSA